MALVRVVLFDYGSVARMPFLKNSDNNSDNKSDNNSDNTSSSSSRNMNMNMTCTWTWVQYEHDQKQDKTVCQSPGTFCSGQSSWYLCSSTFLNRLNRTPPILSEMVGTNHSHMSHGSRVWDVFYHIGLDPSATRPRSQRAPAGPGAWPSGPATSPRPAPHSKLCKWGLPNEWIIHFMGNHKKHWQENPNCAGVGSARTKCKKIIGIVER